jgi:type I restriction enzyme M protein
VSEPISQSELEVYLLGGVTLLRGLIDASDYKQYVFPLLFFKRLSDVWDGDYNSALVDTDDAYARATADDRFVIPEGAHWTDVRSAARDVGRSLVDAFRAIETADPERLNGIFGNAAWTDKSQLPDEVLKNLIEHFSTRTLDLESVPEDQLGNGYEFLIKEFADDSGHTAQEFYTNRTLVHLMVQMLKPVTSETIYDPTVGTGGMLISALAEVKRQGEDPRTLGLYGQELVHITAAIARMNLVLHGVEDFHIAAGKSTLSDPAFTSGDQLATFDVILANPPYSISSWNQNAWANDPYGRNTLGTPPQGRADYAFFQHILSSLDPKTGRCAILFPHGVLFRNEEQAMRRALVEADLIECVLGLGPNLFYNSPMEACVVICRTTKPKDRQHKILLINAVGEITRERAQSFLKPEHQRRIVNAYQEFADEDGFCAVATTEQILENNANLSIPRYIKKTATKDTDDRPLREIWDELQTNSNTFWADMNELVESLESITSQAAADG